MDDLVAWLGEQLDEDERITRAASWTDDANVWHAEPSPFGARDKGQRWFVEDAMEDGVVTHVDPVASDDEGVARHIAEHDPARVLREIDAKRWMREVLASSLKDDSTTGIPRGVAWSMLRRMAEVYQDRPGWQSYWPGSG